VVATPELTIDGHMHMHLTTKLSYISGYGIEVFHGVDSKSVQNSLHMRLPNH
jgi:hypothetical protein